MKRFLSLAALIAVAGVMSVTLYVTAAPENPAGTLRLAVLDFKRLLDGYEKMSAYQKEIKEEQTAFQDEGVKRDKEIQDLEAKLAMHTPGSKAAQDTEKEINTRKAEFETWKQVRLKEILLRERDVIREIYGDVEKTTAEFAKANGISMIFKEERMEVNVQSARELDFRITLRKVLYWSPELDVTGRVVDALNDSYRKARVPAPEKPEAPRPDTPK
jgi:Skp family chaperone for outer membrane proteins